MENYPLSVNFFNSIILKKNDELRGLLFPWTIKVKIETMLTNTIIEFSRNAHSWQCCQFCIAYAWKSKIISVKKVSQMCIEPVTLGF